MTHYYREERWIRREFALLALVAACCIKPAAAAVPQRDMYLRGNIRDENGAPLNDVKCTLNWMTGGSFWVDAGFQDEERTFNGTYEVFRPKDKRLLELFFLKTGHDAKRVHWEDLHADTSPTMVNGQWVLYHDVVMPHKQPMPVLKQWQGELGTTWEDKLVLAGIDSSGEPSKIVITTDTCALDFPYSTGTFLTNTSLVADLVSSPTVHDYLSLPDAAGYEGGRPLSPQGMVAQLRIVNGVTSDGLVRCFPQNPPRYCGQFPAEMSTAPADGYTTTVELRPEDFGDGDDNHKSFFYVRANGKFGKCVIDSCRPYACSYERRGVSCSLLLLMQPDGSRNVATKPPLD